MDPYVKTTWNNGQTALSADNLNKIEGGIYNCTEEVISIETQTIPTLSANLAELDSQVTSIDNKVESIKINYLPLSAGEDYILTGDLYLSAIKDRSGENSISLDDEVNGIYFELKNHALYLFDEDDTTGGTIATREWVETEVKHLYRHKIRLNTTTPALNLYIITTTNNVLNTFANVYSANAIVYYAVKDKNTSLNVGGYKTTKINISENTTSRNYVFEIGNETISKSSTDTVPEYNVETIL